MLVRIQPLELDIDDISWLVKANEEGPVSHQLPVTDMVSRIWQGSLQLFRAECGGVMLTEVNGDRLNLVKMAGYKMALHFQAISRDLQHAARELGCNAIETNVYSEKLARALRRGGAKQESVVMVLELGNG